MGHRRHRNDGSNVNGMDRKSFKNCFILRGTDVRMPVKKHLHLLPPKLSPSLLSLAEIILSNPALLAWSWVGLKFLRGGGGGALTRCSLTLQLMKHAHSVYTGRTKNVQNLKIEEKEEMRSFGQPNLKLKSSLFQKHQCWYRIRANYNNLLLYLNTSFRITPLPYNWKDKSWTPSLTV